jgi:hypothetical protein
VLDIHSLHSPAALSAPKPASLVNKDLLLDEASPSDATTTPRAQLFLYPNNILVETATQADFERISDPDDELDK